MAVSKGGHEIMMTQNGRDDETIDTEEYEARQPY